MGDDNWLYIFRDGIPTAFGPNGNRPVQFVDVIM